MKTSEEQGVGARSLARNTSKVGGVLELRDGTRKIDKKLINQADLHKPNKEVS